MYKPILLVEDSPFDAEFTLRAMRTLSLPNPVLLAHDGEEALEVLLRKCKTAQSDECVSLVLLDLKLPKLDGFDVLKRIKAHPLLKDTPVVVVTGSRLISDKVRAEILGASGVLTKSEDHEEFALQLRTALSPLKPLLQ